jgi:hypothetical protein
VIRHDQLARGGQLLAPDAQLRAQLTVLRVLIQLQAPAYLLLKAELGNAVTAHDDVQIRTGQKPPLLFSPSWSVAGSFVALVQPHLTLAQSLPAALPGLLMQRAAARAPGAVGEGL